MYFRQAKNGNGVNITVLLSPLAPYIVGDLEFKYVFKVWKNLPSSIAQYLNR